MKLTVWIIDDDMVSQFATRYSIEQSNSNCSVTTCDDAEEGLKLLSKQIESNANLPDIILLDLVMPGMNGWEFISKMKDLKLPKEHTNIYILSAFSNSRDRTKAKENPEIHGYFDKPLSRSIASKILQSKSS